MRDWEHIRAEQRRSEQHRRDRTCPHCGNPKNPSRPHGLYLAEREELHRQTPKAVWDEYMKNGDEYTYALVVAISEARRACIRKAVIELDNSAERPEQVQDCQNENGQTQHRQSSEFDRSTNKRSDYMNHSALFVFYRIRGPPDATGSAKL